LELAAAIRDARIEPAALELVSPPLATEALGVDGAEWAVVVRLQGGSEAVGEAEARVRALAGGGRVLAPDAARAQALWAALGERGRGWSGGGGVWGGGRVRGRGGQWGRWGGGEGAGGQGAGGRGRRGWRGWGAGWSGERLGRMAWS